MKTNLHMYEIQMETQTIFNDKEISIRELLEYGLDNNFISFKDDKFHCDTIILNSYLKILHDFDKSETERQDLYDFISSMVGIIISERDFNSKMNEFDEIIENQRKKG